MSVVRVQTAQAHPRRRVGPWCCRQRDFSQQVCKPSFDPRFRVDKITLENHAAQTVSRSPFLAATCDLRRSILPGADDIHSITGPDHWGAAREVSFHLQRKYSLKEAMILTGPDLQAYDTVSDRPISLRDDLNQLTPSGAEFSTATVPANSVMLLQLETL